MIISPPGWRRWAYWRPDICVSDRGGLKTAALEEGPNSGSDLGHLLCILVISGKTSLGASSIERQLSNLTGGSKRLLPPQRARIRQHQALGLAKRALLVLPQSSFGTTSVAPVPGRGVFHDLGPVV